MHGSSIRGNKINKTVIWVVAIIAVATVAAFYVWSSHNRFYIMTSSQGIAYEVDRKTGKSWALMGVEKVPQESPKYAPFVSISPSVLYSKSAERRRNLFISKWLDENAP